MSQSEKIVVPNYEANNKLLGEYEATRSHLLGGLESKVDEKIKENIKWMERTYQDAKKENEEVKKFCESLLKLFKEDDDLFAKLTPTAIWMFTSPSAKTPAWEKILQAITEFDLYRECQKEVIKALTTWQESSKEDRKNAANYFQGLLDTKEQWFYYVDSAPAEIEKLTKAGKHTLAAKLLTEWETTVCNYSPLVRLMSSPRSTDVGASMLFKEVTSQLKLKIQILNHDMKRLQEMWEERKRVTSINERLKTRADFCSLVATTRKQILEKNNFDGLLWDPLTDGCISAAYLAIGKLIDMKLYMHENGEEEPIKCEQVRTMIAEAARKKTNGEDRYAYVLLNEFYRSRNGLLTDKLFLSPEGEIDPDVMNNFISLYDSDPKVKEMGHSGMSMHFTAGQLKHIFSLGWTKYIELRFKEIGIGCGL